MTQDPKNLTIEEALCSVGEGAEGNIKNLYNV